MKKVRVGLVIAILLCITMITLIGCNDNTVSSRNISVDLDKRAAMVEEFEKEFGSSGGRIDVFDSECVQLVQRIGWTFGAGIHAP